MRILRISGTHNYLVAREVKHLQQEVARLRAQVRTLRLAPATGDSIQRPKISQPEIADWVYDRRSSDRYSDRAVVGKHFAALAEIGINDLTRDMPFGVRIGDCLLSKGCRTLGDVFQLSEKVLLGIKNFGAKSRKELAATVIQRARKIDVQGSETAQLVIGDWIYVYFQADHLRDSALVRKHIAELAKIEIAKFVGDWRTREALEREGHLKLGSVLPLSEKELLRIPSFERRSRERLARAVIKEAEKIEAGIVK